VKKTEEDNSFSDNLFKYTVTLSSSANKKLDSVVVQFIFEFYAKVEGQKTVKAIKTINRVVPNMNDFRSDLESNSDLSIEMEFSAFDGKSSDIYSSCKTRYFQSRVFLKVCTIYDVGWRSKYFELDHEVMVCPKIIQGGNVIDEQDGETHQLKTIVVSEANSKFYSE
jgi:hypothetical protein